MELLPSEYFKRQVYACFWFEREIALKTIDLLPDNVLYETDFPHPTSMSPGPASIADVPKDFIERNLSSLPRETLQKILPRQRGARIQPRLLAGKRGRGASLVGALRRATCRGANGAAPGIRSAKGASE